MAYSISRTTSGSANVIVAYESTANAIGLSIAVDYSNQIIELVNIMKDIRDDIRALKERGTNTSQGIAVTNTCWPDECLYNSVLTELSLKDSGLITKYNELLVNKGGNPI